MKIKEDLQISDEQLVKVDTHDFDDMEKVSWTLKTCIKEISSSELTIFLILFHTWYMSLDSQGGIESVTDADPT